MQGYMARLGLGTTRTKNQIKDSNPHSGSSIPARDLKCIRGTGGPR